MNTLATYNNGNTQVTILSDGTKIREYDDNVVPYAQLPESVDVKISDYCDLGCEWCHESSTTSGKHGDLMKLAEVLKPLFPGTEIAMGGGNPLSHPDLIPFLKTMKERGIIANITVNQGHLKPFHDLLVYLIKDELVKGVGISISNNNFKYLKPLLALTDNIVYHLIAGVNDVSVIKKLNNLGTCKVLILGYKKFGFGIKYHNSDVDASILEWRKSLRSIIGSCTISFDNLAIEQLNVRNLFTKEGWEKFYMGDDFTFTMYIDAVKQEFAPTSRSNERESFNNFTLLEYFTQKRL